MDTSDEQGRAMWAEMASARLARIGGRPTEHPIEAMITFAEFVHSGESPPKVLLRWIAEAFDGFVESKGALGVEDLLGLGSSGKRKLAKWWRDGETYYYAESIRRLVEFFGLSVAVAAELVAMRAENGGDIAPNGTTMADEYKSWKNRLEPIPNVIREQYSVGGSARLRFAKSFDAVAVHSIVRRKLGLS